MERRGEASQFCPVPKRQEVSVWLLDFQHPLKGITLSNSFGTSNRSVIGVPEKDVLRTNPPGRLAVQVLTQSTLKHSQEQ